MEIKSNEIEECVSYILTNRDPKLSSAQTALLKFLLETDKYFQNELPIEKEFPLVSTTFKGEQNHNM